MNLEDNIKFLNGEIKRAKRELQLAKGENQEQFLINYRIKQYIECQDIMTCISNDKALLFARCENCDELHITKRENQRACSDKCRQALHRKKQKENETVDL